MDTKLIELISNESTTLKVNAMKKLSEKYEFMEICKIIKIPQNSNKIKFTINPKNDSGNKIELYILDLNNENLKKYIENNKIVFDSDQYFNISDIKNSSDSSNNNDNFLDIYFSYVLYEDKEFDIKMEFYS